MKIEKYFFCLLIILLSTGVISSQEKKTYLARYMVVRSAPAFTLEMNLHYNQSIFELSGAYNDDFNSSQVLSGETFGADKGFGGSVTGKISLSPRGRMRGVFSLGFNNIKTYLFGKKLTLADNGESKFNVFTAGIGLEHCFTPNHNFKVYVGAEITSSMISGKSHIWVQNPLGTPYEFDLKYKNSFRLGYSVSAGTEYLMSNSFGLNIGFKFNHNNAFFKQEADVTSVAGIPNETYEIALPDGAPVTNTQNFINGKKGFGYISIMAGAVLYFGITEKRYNITR